MFSTTKFYLASIDDRGTSPATIVDVGGTMVTLKLVTAQNGLRVFIVPFAKLILMEIDKDEYEKACKQVLEHGNLISVDPNAFLKKAPGQGQGGRQHE